MKYFLFSNIKINFSIRFIKNLYVIRKKEYELYTYILYALFIATFIFLLWYLS